MSRYLNALAVVCLAAAPAAAQELGRPATPEEIAAWDIDVRPDGAGAPQGSGDVSTGEEVYMNACSSCHGVFGEGEGRWPVLMGGEGTLDGSRPVKTVGSYWPYLSTVYDYVHRAMPFGAAQSLTDDEVYAVTAYLLYLNDLVDQDFTLSSENIGSFEMPNRDGFFIDDREETELPRFTREPCMEACKDEVEITMRAAVLDVTPEEPAAETERQGADAASEGGGSDRAELAGEATGGNDEGQQGSLTMASSDPELVEKGESLFRQCQACHQVGEGAENRTGPHLTGVFGRAAGGLENYDYSEAMTAAGESGLVWDAVSLEAFLADPRSYMQGTKMTYRGMDESDIPAMLAYLASLDGE